MMDDALPPGLEGFPAVMDQLVTEQLDRGEAVTADWLTVAVCRRFPTVDPRVIALAVQDGFADPDGTHDDATATPADLARRLRTQ